MPRSKPSNAKKQVAHLRVQKFVKKKKKVVDMEIKGNEKRGFLLEKDNLGKVFLCIEYVV